MAITSELRLGLQPSQSYSMAAIRVIGRLTELFLAVITVGTLAAAIAISVAALAGVHARIEQSGSMAPALRPGNLRLVEAIRPGDARAGQIIAFYDPSRKLELTHRAISVTRHGGRVRFVTRGDANTGIERWSVPASATIGREVLDLPEVGRMIESLRAPPLMLAVWLAVPFVLLSLLRRIRRTR